MIQNTLFGIKKQVPILDKLKPINLSHMAMFDEKLYSKIPGQIMYNHCYHYLYSYFSKVKEAFYYDDGENFLVVCKKFKTTPLYMIHAPNPNSCSYSKFMEIYQQLSEISSKPVMVIDMNEDQANWVAEGQPDMWDIQKDGIDSIFDLEKCVAMRGNPYKGIRNGINQFKRNKHTVVNMDTQQAADDAVKVIREWQKTQGKKYFRVTVGRDIEVFQRFWSVVDRVNTFGLVVYDKEGEPIGATMACRSAKNPEFGMEITTKVLPEYNGLTDYLSMLEFKQMLDAGIKFSNEAGYYSKGIKFNKEKWRPSDEYKMFKAVLKI